MNKVYSYKSNIEKIVKNKQYFIIPAYQRLYVWKEEQIRKLLEDIYNAILSKKDAYYIGSLIVIKKNGLYQLIDGQQRFTTIYIFIKTLIYYSKEFELTKDNKDFLLSFEDKNKYRLSFEARKFANDFICNNFTMNNADNKLMPFIRAIEIIKNFLEEKINKKNDFIEYIKNKLVFIITEMPERTDVNKLFETFNNRGIQLKQHEILKSYILKPLRKSERKVYSNIWDMCSMMDSYIEKNLKEYSKLTWLEILKISLKENEEKDISNKNIPDDIDSIKELISDKSNGSVNSSDDYYPENVRSIISFPMLLLHTLRIYFIDKGSLDRAKKIPVKEKELINIFTNNFLADSTKEKDIKYFFSLLWKIRVKFDMYIVKWINDGDNNEEVLDISKIYISKNNQNNITLQRKTSDKANGFVILQSMLYHSYENITQYWLTPILYKIVKDCNFNEDTLYNYSKKLDNILYFYNNGSDLSEKTINICIERNINLDKNMLNNLEEELRKDIGRSFYRYWFYKFDFILWNIWYVDRNNIFSHYTEETKKNIDNILQNYRMNSKNSIEHVYPQHPSNNKINWENEYLHSFANLVLISKGLNSKYSNLSYNEKYSKFITEVNEKHRIDSLKSLLIFEYYEEEDSKYYGWTKYNCQNHLENVIKIFKDYYNSMND